MEAIAAVPVMRELVIWAAGARCLPWHCARTTGLLGAFIIYRQEVRPFSEQADRAVAEFRGAGGHRDGECAAAHRDARGLEQQTATAEVLQVINSSPGDLAPVFDAMLERAIRLCDAKIGTLWTYDGEQFQLAAVHGGSQALSDALARSGRGYDRMSTRARALRGEHVTHTLDARESEAYLSGDPVRRAMVDLGGGRALVTVSLRKDDAVLGIFTIYRQDVRAFSDKQIALLQNFAAQAVIAMENARLLTETREALEQQTATAEVLQVINSSPGDLAPVFDAMLEKALRLCGGAFGMMNTCNGESWRRVADHGTPAAYAEYRRQNPQAVYGPDTAPGRLIAGEDVVHNVDLMAEEAYARGEPNRRALVDLGGARTFLAVALRKGTTLLGNFAIYRQEVRPFSDKQIALLQNFAAQAVIAMENARLITETREALEQQTATAEVLQVINSSPGDLAPVFDAMLEKAIRLCEAVLGTLATYDGEFFRFVAVHGEARMVEERTGAWSATAISGVTWPRLLCGDSVVHVTDVTDTDALPHRPSKARRWFVDLGGGRTLLTYCVAQRGCPARRI